MEPGARRDRPPAARVPSARALDPGVHGGPGPAARRGRPATMQDIAAATGVSRSTVSRILNDAPLAVPIAQNTRERVLAVARDLGFRPNPLARALRGAPTMLLGAIVRDITDPFFAGAIEAVSSAARSRGYNIVLGHAHARATEAHELAAVLEARQCDAILLLGDMGDQPRLLADLRDSHVPVIALWQGTFLDLIPGVQVDNRLGIRLAVEHLVGLGHRRIAFIGGRLLGDIRERQATYVGAVSSILGTVPPGYIQHVANAPEGGEDALRALLRLSPRPTAIVASTDVLAIGVLRGALLQGLTVPDELSVVGFDDIPMARVTVPGLTTIRMPIQAMAVEAIALAVGSQGEPTEDSGGTDIDGTGPGVETGATDATAGASDATAGATTVRHGRSTMRVFPPSLVIRQSTAAPPAEAAASGGGARATGDRRS
jgi:DNA-binding LacI/PurR family transcriptional regulator